MDMNGTAHARSVAFATIAGHSRHKRNTVRSMTLSMRNTVLAGKLGGV